MQCNNKIPGKEIICHICHHWGCLVCTYLNSAECMECQMCNAKKQKRYLQSFFIRFVSSQENPVGKSLLLPRGGANVFFEFLE